MAKYTPGNEPDNIKKRLNTLFAKLDTWYPDKIVTGLNTDHKKAGETVTELYRLLEYPDGPSFLNAYGYGYAQKTSTGRPKGISPQEAVDILKKRYPEGSDFTSPADLFEANPDLPFKTITNNATQAFGMPLKQYLLSVGLLKKYETAEEKKALLKPYTVVEVAFPPEDVTYLYVSPTKSIHEGDYVEVPFKGIEGTVYGTVRKVMSIIQADLPKGTGDVLAAVNKTNYNKSLNENMLRIHTAAATDALVQSRKTEPFVPQKKATDMNGEEMPWACCRGLSKDVLELLRDLIVRKEVLYELNDILLVEPGIAELYVFGEEVDWVVKNYPCIKLTAFAWNKDKKTLSVAFSESGYPFFTDKKAVRSCNKTEAMKWLKEHHPAENCEKDGFSYRFPFEKEWTAEDYVLRDTGVRLGNL